MTKPHSIWETTEVAKVMKPVHRIKMWNWLCNHFDTDAAERDGNPASMIPFEEINAPRKAVAELSENFVLSTTKVVKRQESERGDTTKLLLECHDGHQIETVVMRHSNYSTVCVSSQVGCKMGCKFCATGTMGIIRDLTAGEIIEQVAHANSVTRIRNVVFMGMGEPLNNYEQLREAIQVFQDQRLFSMSPKHLTVSTVGVLKEMRRLEDEFPLVNFALSLHAPNQEVRLKIVPTAGANPFQKLLDSLDYRIDHERERRAAKDAARLGADVAAGTVNTSGKKVKDVDEDRISSYTATIMIEYILLSGVNDMPELAHELGAILKPRKNFILLNLIPYNPTDVGDDFIPPTDDRIKAFHEILIGKDYRIHTRVRKEMGQDIDGACGQLVVEGQKRKKAAAKPGVPEIEDLQKRGKGGKNGNGKPKKGGKKGAGSGAAGAGAGDEGVVVTLLTKRNAALFTSVAVAVLSGLFVWRRLSQRSAGR
jgi:sorting nexin-8